MWASYSDAPPKHSGSDRTSQPQSDICQRDHSSGPFARLPPTSSQRLRRLVSGTGRPRPWHASTVRTSCDELFVQARRDRARGPPAIAREHGDRQTFKAACKLVPGLYAERCRRSHAAHGVDSPLSTAVVRAELRAKIAAARRYGREPPAVSSRPQRHGRASLTNPPRSRRPAARSRSVCRPGTRRSARGRRPSHLSLALEHACLTRRQVRLTPARRFPSADGASTHGVGVRRSASPWTVSLRDRLAPTQPNRLIGS